MSHSTARVRRLHNLLNIPVQRNDLPYLSIHRSNAAQHAASQIFAPMVGIRCHLVSNVRPTHSPAHHYSVCCTVAHSAVLWIPLVTFKSPLFYKKRRVKSLLFIIVQPDVSLAEHEKYVSAIQRGVQMWLVNSVLDFEMIEYRHTPARHLQHVLLV